MPPRPEAFEHRRRRQDVFPVQAAVARRPAEILYTANGRIWRRGSGRRSRDGSTGSRRQRPRSSRSPRRCRCNAAPTRSRIARSSRPGRKSSTGIVSPVVSPDGRAIAFTAMGDLWVLPAGGQPVQVTNDAAMEIDPAWSPDSTRIAFASDRGGHMDLWVRDLRDNRDSQLTDGARRRLGPGMVAGRQPHRLPARSPDTGDDRSAARRASLRVHASDARASWGGRPGRPTATRSRSAACSRTRTAIAKGSTRLLLYSVEQQRRVVVGDLPGHSAGNRQDTGPGVVARRLPHGLRQRRRAVGRAGRRARRRHRAAAGDRRPINRSRRAGKAIRSTSSTRRREVCAASSPTAACPIRFRSISPGATARRRSASSSTPDTCSTACSKRCAARRTS